MSEEVVLGHAAEAGTDFLIYTSNYCGYCTAAKRMFEQKNLTFKEINFDENPQVRNDVVAATGRRTVPVIFDLRGEAPMYIGGFDETSRYLRK
jgi:glutaredoxin 3